MPNSLRTAVIIVVAAVWAINFTAPVIHPDYHPAQELNVAFMAIMGVLTASYQRDDEKKKAKHRKDDDDEEDGGKTHEEVQK